MNIQFELDALAFFTRSGHVTWQVGKERFRMDTPAFIPRIHEAFLDFTPYQEALSEIFRHEWTGMAALPNLGEGRNGIRGKRALSFLANQGNHVIPMREYPFLIDNTNDLNETILVAITGLDITNNPPHGSSPAFNAVQDLQDHQRRKIASALPGMNSSIARDVSNLVNMRTDGIVEGKEQELDLPRFIISKQFELKHHPPAQLMQHSRLLHERIPLDVMRISDVSCLPRDATMLVHAGFDGMLENGLLEATSRKKYLFQGEIFDISSRKVLPCTCKHCIALQDQDFRYLETWEMQVLLYCHNLLQMAKAVAFLRELIRNEGFRHHVEVWSHGLPSHGTWLSTFNEHVQKLANMLQPLDLKRPVPLTGVASYFRPDIVRFRHKVSHWYHFPGRTRIVVLLPCSARKPYKDSKSHRKFIQAMNRGWKRWSQVTSELMITSPLGIVPRQVEDCFPAAHYDLPVTGYWDQRELAFTRETLIDVLRDPLPVSFKEEDSKKSNIIILAHLDGGYREAVESSISSLPYPVEFTGDYQHAGSRDALASLERAMDELEKEFTGPLQDLSNREMHLQDIRCLVDFQFETSLGDSLIPRDAKISRKHGGMLYIHDGKSHQPILHQDIHTGYLVLDELGVQLAWSAGCSRSETMVKCVTFNGSKLRGSNLFPAGIDSVDESIAVGDDAFVVDLEGNLLGYGKAIVPGNRMLEMKRGAVMSLTKKVKPGRRSRNAR